MDILLHCGQMQLCKTHVSALHFHRYVTSGWEREVQSQAPGTGVSSGRCAAAPCAWWRPRSDGIVVPPGTP